MRKAKIYKPTKTAMQSGSRNTKNWILEYEFLKTGLSPLMGWESSNDMLSEIRLEFSTKDKAIDYAKKNNISYYVINPKDRKLVKKSYSDNFTK